ncbi:MAG: hypothetical protein RL485_305 [Bacteroidota bacterium]
MKQVGKVHRRRLGHGAGLGEILFESAPVPQIRIHILAQQRNLLVAVVPKLGNLFDDRLWVAAALTSPREGHHTKRTHVVAASGNAHEGRDAVAAKAHGFNVVVGFFFTKDDVHRLAAAVQLLEQVGKVAVGIWAHDQVDKLLFVKKLLANPLGHAAQHADFQFRILRL